MFVYRALQGGEKKAKKQQEGVPSLLLRGSSVCSACEESLSFLLHAGGPTCAGSLSRERLTLRELFEG
jgi:hypothetical protein